MQVYRDGALVCERRYYPISSTQYPFLRERYYTPTYNEDGTVNYVMTDNNTAWDGHPPLQVTGWQFFARDAGVESEIAFDGDGNWKESALRQLDAKELCTRQIALTSTGAIAQDIRFTRDDAGKVTGFTYGLESYTISYTLDDKGNWILLDVAAVPRPGQPLIVPWSLQRNIVYAEPP
jgi:hypothetical protein